MGVFICGHEMMSAAGHGSASCFQNLLPHLPTDSAHNPVYDLHHDSEQVLKKLLESEEGKTLAEYDRAAQILAATSLLLRTKSRIPQDRSRFGAVIATSRGATGLLEKAVSQYLAFEKVRPKTSPLTSSGIFASLVAHLWGLEGGQFTISSTCTSGLNAIGIGFHLIKSGLFDHCLTGGSESALTPFSSSMMSAAKVTATSKTDRLESMGASAKGMILGEGAALIYLSTQQQPETFAQIRAFSMTTESAGLTGITETGEALQQAMQRALSEAGWTSSELDLIVPHGSGTQRGDAAEARAYQHFFSNRNSPLPPIFPTKWKTGHTLGAAGTQSVCFALEALRNNKINLPPYPLLAELHSNLLQREIKKIMICALGFGGGASCLLIEKIAH